MKLIEEIRLDDISVVKRLALLQLGLALAAILGSCVFILYKPVEFSLAVPSVWSLLFLFSLLAVSIVVHELIHLCVLKMFVPHASVKLVCSSAYVGISCVGIRLTRGKFLAVLLAPLMLMSFLCLAAAWYTSFTLSFLLCFVVQFAGAAGDLYMAQRIIQSGAELCEDTEEGIRLFSWR